VRLCELNPWDRRLIEKHLEFYQALDAGTVAPKTPAQHRFVRMCRGEASPKTQHEIAYSKYLRVHDISIPSHPESNRGYDSVVPSDKAVVIVETIEEEELGDSRWKETVLTALGKVRDGYRSGLIVAKDAASDAALWSTTILSDPGFSRGIEQWMGETFNTVSNVYTKAMDGPFAVTGPIAGDITTQPMWHRLFGGHTLVEAREAVRGALPDDTFTQEFLGELIALGSDMASKTGLPLVTFTEAGFDSFVSFSSKLGLSNSYINDILSENALELVGATIPVIAAALTWDKADEKRFIQLAGAMGIAGAYSGNPLLIIVALVMAARAYHLTKGSGDQSKWAFALAKGGFLSGLLFSVSAVIGGPAWVGLLAGICVMMLAKRADSPVPAKAVVKFIRSALHPTHKGLVPASSRTR